MSFFVKIHVDKRIRFLFIGVFIPTFFLHTSEVKFDMEVILIDHLPKIQILYLLHQSYKSDVYDYNDNKLLIDNLSAYIRNEYFPKVTLELFKTDATCMTILKKISEFLTWEFQASQPDKNSATPAGNDSATSQPGKSGAIKSPAPKTPGISDFHDPARFNQVIQDFAYFILNICLFPSNVIPSSGINEYYSNMILSDVLPNSNFKYNLTLTTGKYLTTLFLRDCPKISDRVEAYNYQRSQQIFHNFESYLIKVKESMFQNDRQQELFLVDLSTKIPFYLPLSKYENNEFYQIFYEAFDRWLSGLNSKFNASGVEVYAIEDLIEKKIVEDIDLENEDKRNLKLESPNFEETENIFESPPDLMMTGMTSDQLNRQLSSNSTAASTKPSRISLPSADSSLPSSQNLLSMDQPVKITDHNTIENALITSSISAPAKAKQKTPSPISDLHPLIRNYLQNEDNLKNLNDKYLATSKNSVLLPSNFDNCEYKFETKKGRLSMQIYSVSQSLALVYGREEINMYKNSPLNNSLIEHNLLLLKNCLKEELYGWVFV